MIPRTMLTRSQSPSCKSFARLVLLHSLLVIASPSASLAAGGREIQGPLPHSVYVWQRAWTDGVRESVSQHAPDFNEVVVLGAEVSWKDRQPQITRVAVNYSSLAGTNCRVGLALRIGAFSGPFAANDANTRRLESLAESLIAAARTNSVTPFELQLDFDCAESKLDGYRVWLEAIQRRVAPVPVTITALPSWLGSPGFARLAAASTNYVLQVHSLERPRDINDKFSLCDTQAAMRAVERAGNLGVPFRVALPTYGYLLAFKPDGKFLGLSAEGPVQSWPQGTRIREVRADPVEMAALVSGWNTNRPSALRGVIWYRLPVAADNLNWRWQTLSDIVHAKPLGKNLNARARRIEPGLVEISVANEGSLDDSSRLTVAVRWSREGGTRLVAGDGLRGFKLTESGEASAAFQVGPHTLHLRAGETNVIGWLRFNRDCEVDVELKKD